MFNIYFFIYIYLFFNNIILFFYPFWVFLHNIVVLFIYILILSNHVFNCITSLDYYLSMILFIIILLFYSSFIYFQLPLFVILFLYLWSNDFYLYSNFILVFSIFYYLRITIIKRIRLKSYISLSYFIILWISSFIVIL